MVYPKSEMKLMTKGYHFRNRQNQEYYNKKKKKRKAKEQNGEMGCNNCFIEVAGFVVSSHHNR